MEDLRLVDADRSSDVQEDFITAAEAAPLLGLHPMDVWSVWATYGKADQRTSCKISGNKRVYSRSAVLRWAEQIGGKRNQRSGKQSPATIRRKVQAGPLQRALRAFFAERPHVPFNDLAALCDPPVDPALIAKHLNGKHQKVYQDTKATIMAAIASYDQTAPALKPVEAPKPLGTVQRTQAPAGKPRRSLMSRFFSWLAART